VNGWILTKWIEVVEGGDDLEARNGDKLGGAKTEPVVTRRPYLPGYTGAFAVAVETRDTCLVRVAAPVERVQALSDSAVKEVDSKWLLTSKQDARQETLREADRQALYDEARKMGARKEWRPEDYWVKGA